MNDFEMSNKNSSDFYGDKPKSNFGKNVVFPFVSGILGASLVVGICFGVPSVKEKLISTEDTLASTSPSKQELTRNYFYSSNK